MKRLILYLAVVVAISVASCKGKSVNSSGDSTATDTGQAHVGGSITPDSAKLPVSPVETGGQDTSADGTTNTNPAKDTVTKKR